MTEYKNKILVYYVHPAAHISRINKYMIDEIDSTPGVTVRRLYDLYPDFYINVPEEQKFLLEHDIIVWQHPFYWYSAPSLLKEWIDLVLEHGFAYGKGGDALKGKKVMTAITTGGREDAYRENGRNRYTINQLLTPYDQTVHLCNMTYLPPFVLHGSLLIDPEEAKLAARLYKQVVISLRDNLFDEKDIKKKKYIQELLD